VISTARLLAFLFAATWNSGSGFGAAFGGSVSIGNWFILTFELK
jgi:hypothetical protein